MTSGDRSTALTALARTGFSRLEEADAGLGELEQLTGAERADAMALAQRVADPDRALAALVQIARRDPAAIRTAAGMPARGGRCGTSSARPTDSRSSTSGIPMRSPTSPAPG